MRSKRAAVLAVMTTVAAVAAADEPTTQPAAKRSWLDEVVVTAFREEVAAFAASYTVDVVSLTDFASQRQHRTIPEALRSVPGVMVQKTGHGQGSPYIRGFTGFRTLLLVDGVRVNNSIFRDGPNQYWATIDPASIDHLEIVRGSGSVQYGSDAIGGVVNAITRSPVFQDGSEFRWFREVTYRVSSAERSHSVRGEINANWGQLLGALAGGTYRNFGDLHSAGIGEQKNTGYQEGAGDVKLVIRPGPNERIVIAHYQFYQDDASRTHRTIHGSGWENTTIGTELTRVLDQGRSLTYVQYHREKLGAAVDAVHLGVSLQRMTERRFRVRPGDRRDKQGFEVETYGLFAQLESPSPVGRWTYGFDIYHDEVDSFRRDDRPGRYTVPRIQGPVADDATYTLAGLFVQDRIPICDRVEATIGARATLADANANNVQEPRTGTKMSVDGRWDNVVTNGRLSVMLDEKDRFNLYGGYSQGFRAPNLSDLTRLDTARTNEIETASPDLDPEKFVTYEIGLKTRTDTFQGQVVYYYTDIHEMIVRAATGRMVDGANEVTKRNAGDGHIQGIELQGRWEVVPQWTVFGDVSYLYGEVKQFPTSGPDRREEVFSRMMPATGRVGVRWDSRNKTVYAEAVCTMAAGADKLSTRDKLDTSRIGRGGTPSYVVVDLRGGWRVCDGLEVFGGVDNVTNEEYRVHGSGLNEPGINFKGGVRWRF